MRPALDRFLEKVSMSDGCWLWTAYTMKNGYGMFGLKVNGKNRKVLAHRFSLAASGVDVPDGMDVDHLCRVRNCVRPDHLRVATRKENLNAPGSLVGKIKAPREHCKYGHPFDAKNTYVWRGQRGCNICRKRRTDASNAKQKLNRKAR